jgi:hypothetical protein
MIAQKSSQEVKEEKVLFSSTCPTTKPPGLFAPNTPLSLARHYARDSHAAHDTIAGQLCRVLYLLVHHEGVGQQS